MNLQRGSGWMRRGLTLLWDPVVLSNMLSPGTVVSIRGFFAMKECWPEELPSATGDALVVVGVEGCLDALAGDDDRSVWLESDLKPAILSFQEEYQGQAALILWLPSGRKRINMITATEEYVWRNRTSELPIGRYLWAGSRSDAARIIAPGASNPNVDGDDYVGLYHPRIS